jgi:hypothetical protein
MRAMVDSTRADNASPLIGRIWFIEDELNTGNGAATSGVIYARLSASQPAGDASPYGVFHADFCALPNGSTSCLDGFYGFADGNGAAVSAFQTGERNISMLLNGTTTAGSGRIKVSERSGAAAADWKFAYDAAHFRRAGNDNGNDQCFDRSFANADKTAWRYGVYSADGSRLERNSGFPIKAGNVYGYVGYWGLWLPGSATLADGTTVTRYSYGGGAQPSAADYVLVNKDGRMKKQVKHQTTLDGIQGVPINFWVNQDFVDSGGTPRTAGTNLEIRWIGSQFVITGVQTQGGQTTSDTAGHTLPPALLAASWNINSWSPSLGGSVTIVTRDLSGAYLAPSPTSAVTYRAESVVAPGSADWPANLHCVSDCPVGGSAFTAGMNGVGGSPYASVQASDWNGGTHQVSSQFNWSPIAAASVLNYSADAASGLLTAVGGSVAWTAATAPGNAQYQNGFQSGRLVDDAGLASLACGAQGGTGSGWYCPNKVDEVATTYVWETGPNSWNRFSGLRASGGGFVSFDPPLQLAYAVPGSVSAGYAGANLVLQYNAFGELNGIPGQCVDPVTNGVVPCDNSGANRWVAAFVIPEGSAVYDGATAYYVKPLEQELRLKRVAGAACTGLPLPTITDSDLPGAASFADPRAIGAVPTVSGAPRVIDGVVQF